MVDVHVRFDGADPRTAQLTRRALQPVLNVVYRQYAGRPQPEVEEVLRRVGRGSFMREGIELFAVYISAGNRPVLTGAIEENSQIAGREWIRSRRVR